MLNDEGAGQGQVIRKKGCFELAEADDCAMKKIAGKGSLNAA